MEGWEKKTRVFLEEDLVDSMWHKYQDEGSCLIGLFKFLQEWEASMQCGQEVGPVGKSVEEANRSNGPGLQNHSPPPFEVRSEVGP